MGICNATDCDRRSVAADLCDTHYRQLKRRGWTGPIPPNQQQSNNGNWRGGQIRSYAALHWHLRKLLGPAYNYVCISCDDVAYEWSYDHKDPDARYSAIGIPYSIDLDHYWPMCRSCHRRADRKRANDRRSEELAGQQSQ